MIFHKQMRKICAHCLHGQPFSAEHELCLKHGPVSPDYTCPGFEYDPLRRQPPPPAQLKLPEDEAFRLE